MKKLLTLLIGIFLTFGVMSTTAFADDKELRAAWISTVSGLDWPNTQNNIEGQKQEFITLLDKLQSAGMNAVMVQIRPSGDALYNSSINPWSEVLTGTQGKDPGYDPLAFMIQETHKRGMEFHAWFNPYRVTTSGTAYSKLALNNVARIHNDWTVIYEDKIYLDPGNPNVVNHMVDTVAEVVNKYDVDGIHFDDYFYPSSSFNDSTSYATYGNGMNKDDWRRQNVNTLIQRVDAKIKSIDSTVEFGVSPRGIWKNSSSDPAGSSTHGAQSYYDIYCDSVAWIKNGWVDYIAPQIYWTFGNSAAPYGTLVDWWSKQVQGTDVKLYIGQAAYKDGSQSYPENVVSEIDKQVEYIRMNSEVDGSIYFRAKSITSNATLTSKLKQLNAVPLKKFIGLNRYETSVKVSKEGWANGSDTVLLVNGYANADGLTATPLASAYGAPILLTDTNDLDTATKNEIKRLNPSKVILVGGDGVISNDIITQINGIKAGVTVERLGGIDRYETSLKVAQKLDASVDVTKAYVCFGHGEPDALSIASKAGEEKAPIILVECDTVTKNTLDWLKGESLETAYFIGGTGIIYNNVISQINAITSSDVSGNRVAGVNRYDTNAAVISKFYSGVVQPVSFAAKGDILADALTSGPLAAKLKAPVILMNSELSTNQKQVLSTKKALAIYEVGGGINSSALSNLINILR